MLDGFFINPILALRWDDFTVHVKRMAKLGARKIIVQWTSGHGWSFYPSKAYNRIRILSDDSDWIGWLLETALDYQIDVCLRLRHD